MFGWGHEPWHPPMLVPCDGPAAIDRCQTMRAILSFAGAESYRLVPEAMQTCPFCGHVRARRTYQ